MKRRHLSFFLAFFLLKNAFAQNISQVLDSKSHDPSGKGDWFFRLAFDKKNRLWTGSDAGELFCFEGNIWKNIPINNVTIGEIREIEFDSKGGLWVGTKDNGIFYRDSLNKWTPFPQSITGATSDWIRTIRCFGNRTYFGTGNELLEFDGKVWKIYNKTSSPALQELWINDMEIDRNGNLWIVFQRTLFWITPNYVLEKKGDFTTEITSIAFDKDNNTIISTLDYFTGIQKWKLDKPSNTIKSFLIPYSNYGGSNLVVDKDDRLWWSAPYNTGGIKWYDGKNTYSFYDPNKTHAIIYDLVLDPNDNNKIWETGQGSRIFEITMPTIVKTEQANINIPYVLKKISEDEIAIYWEENSTIVKINIFDTQGGLLNSNSIQKTDNHAIIQISKYSNGLFFIQLVNDKKQSQFIKFISQ